MGKKFELLNETENYCFYYCFEDTTMQVTDKDGNILAEGDHDDNWWGLCPAMQEMLDKADAEGLFDGTFEIISKVHVAIKTEYNGFFKPLRDYDLGTATDEYGDSYDIMWGGHAGNLTFEAMRSIMVCQPLREFVLKDGRFYPVLFDAEKTGDFADIEKIRNAASSMGKKGGKSTSEAKAKAARANGAKGGRPRKTREEV